MLTLTLAITLTAASWTLRTDTSGADIGAPRLTTRIADTIVDTWRCQDRLGVRRTRAASPWKPHSTGYRQWALRRWQERRAACLKVLHARAATIARLNRGIDGYYRSQGRRSGPMSGQGPALELAGRTYGVSPYFIFAVSVTESSGGLAACRNNRFNVWGLSSCTSGWHVPAFRSWAEAFDFFARFVTGRTPVTSGWPAARTPYDFHGYAACTSCWGDKTAGHMRRVFGVAPEVRYP